MKSTCAILFCERKKKFWVFSTFPHGNELVRVLSTVWKMLQHLLTTLNQTSPQRVPFNETKV